MLLGRGWRDQDDADRLRHDPSFRMANDTRRGVAALEPDSVLPSQPTLSRLVGLLSAPTNQEIVRGDHRAGDAPAVAGQQRPAAQAVDDRRGRPAVRGAWPAASGRNAAPVVDHPGLGWWREARFGMFIHWGLYAIPAGVWEGEEVPGIGEWIMFRRRIPRETYAALAERFDPVRFDARAWVELAVQAGMRYLVITSKHHDGFAIFRSSCCPYNIDATPFGRDPLAELAEACAEAGIRLGFYYSQDQDWHDPDGSRNNWDFAESGKDFAAYLERKVKPQLRSSASC